jgi:hypothetical protein
MFQIFVDRFQENVQVNGLAQIIGAATVHTFFSIFLAGEGGQSNDCCLAPPSAQFNRGGVPVHHGHLHIHQNQIERVLRGNINGDLPVFRDDYVRTQGAQMRREQALIISSILSEKNLAAGKNILLLISQCNGWPC